MHGYRVISVCAHISKYAHMCAHIYKYIHFFVLKIRPPFQKAVFGKRQKGNAYKKLKCNLSFCTALIKTYQIIRLCFERHKKISEEI